MGKNTTVPYTVLQKPILFSVVLVGGAVVPMTVTHVAKVLTHTASTVTWEATLTGGGVTLTTQGTMDFDSYLEFSVTVVAGATVEVADIVVEVQPTNETAKMMCGMGVDGQYIDDIVWHWDLNRGNNRLWLGRTEAGVYFYPRGTGPNWENPSYSKDYPIMPFIPTSWGGVNATNAQTTNTGASVTNGTMKTSSGARTLKAGESLTFLFDVAFTPSKPLDLRHHWKSRYLQIGYGGVGYTTPEQAHADGVTVATLHQGIGGLWNSTHATDSMVNPYINWPFVPDVVNFMEDYTHDAHALGMQVKFYYTIRELTNHVVELHVFVFVSVFFWGGG
jgi:hypothetical protein